MKKEEQNPLRRFELSVEELEDVSGGKMEDYMTPADITTIKGLLYSLITQGGKKLTIEETKAASVQYLFVVQRFYPNATQEDLDDFIDDHYNEVVNQ